MCSNESTISNQPECYCFTLRTSTPLLYIYYIGTEYRRKPLLHTVSFKLYILALNFRLLLWHDYHWMKNSVVQTWLLLFPEVFFCTYLCSRLLNTYVFFLSQITEITTTTENKQIMDVQQCRLLKHGKYLNSACIPPCMQLPPGGSGVCTTYIFEGETGGMLGNLDDRTCKF